MDRWEGVTFYISGGAVDDVLGFVRRQAAPKSGIVFDYIFRSIVDGTCDAFGARETFEYVRRRREPFTFGLDETNVPGFLGERGLDVEEHLLPEDMEARYLGAHARDRVFRVGGFYGIVTARTR